jgi:hypothetical protein
MMFGSILVVRSLVLVFFLLIFSTYLHSLQFESTLITPQNDPNSGGANQAEISALLTTSDAQHLLRNLVSNSAGPNTWAFQASYAPEYESTFHKMRRPYADTLIAHKRLCPTTFMVSIPLSFEKIATNYSQSSPAKLLPPSSAKTLSTTFGKILSQSKMAAQLVIMDLSLTTFNSILQPSPPSQLMLSLR